MALTNQEVRSGVMRYADAFAWRNLPATEKTAVGDAIRAVDAVFDTFVSDHDPAATIKSLFSSAVDTAGTFNAKEKRMFVTEVMRIRSER